MAARSLSDIFGMREILRQGARIRARGGAELWRKIGIKCGSRSRMPTGHRRQLRASDDKGGPAIRSRTGRLPRARPRDDARLVSELANRAQMAGAPFP